MKNFFFYRSSKKNKAEQTNERKNWAKKNQFCGLSSIPKISLCYKTVYYFHITIVTLLKYSQPIEEWKKIPNEISHTVETKLEFYRISFVCVCVHPYKDTHSVLLLLVGNTHPPYQASSTKNFHLRPSWHKREKNEEYSSWDEREQ